MSDRRVPEFDPGTGLYRLECPFCHKLQLRFHASVRGGPIELQCTRSECKHKLTVYFNTGGPEWSPTT